MKNITDEIKLTIEMMRGDIDDGAHGELQSHLYSLLEMKRIEIQQRLVERSWLEPVTHDRAPYKSVKLDGQISDEAKPLTTEELKAGGWWCADVSNDCAKAFESKSLRVFNAPEWGDDGGWGNCGLDDDGDVTRGFYDLGGKKQIHRIGNQFFWSDDK